MTHSLPEIRSKLFVSVLSDCLDAAGVTDQALPSFIRPLDEASVMAGRARTAQMPATATIAAAAMMTSEICSRPGGTFARCRKSHVPDSRTARTETV